MYNELLQRNLTNYEVNLYNMAVNTGSKECMASFDRYISDKAMAEGLLYIASLKHSIYDNYK